MVKNVAKIHKRLRKSATFSKICPILLSILSQKHLATFVKALYPVK